MASGAGCVGGTELRMLLSMAREPPYSRIWGSGALCPVAEGGRAGCLSEDWPGRDESQRTPSGTPSPPAPQESRFCRSHSVCAGFPCEGIRE